MKINYRLNHYLSFAFFIILTLILLIFSIQYYVSKKTIKENFSNKIYKDALHIREDFRLSFDKMQYDFKQKEQENIDKLNFAINYIANNKDFSVKALEKELNKHISFGKYEVFIINKNYVIEDSSYKPDIGLDFKQFKTINVLFDSIYSGKKFIDISPPKIDSASMNLKRYLVGLSKDKNKLIQISYALDSLKIIKSKHKTLEKLANNIQLYMATRYSIQPIDLVSSTFKKTNLKKDWDNTILVLKDLSQNFPRYKNRVESIISINVENKIMMLNDEVSKIFVNKNKLLISVDTSKDNSYVYSITNGLFNDKNETKLLVKTTFRNKEINKEIDETFITLLLVYFVIASILILLYKFILNNISNKLIKIISHINKNDKSNEKSIVIEEIRSLQDDYNKLHKKLNKEINKNQLLLSQNKEFIADMVHQIRTPLSVIMTNTNLIEMTQKSKNTKEFIDSINASINMLSNSYEDLSFVVSNDNIQYNPKYLSLSYMLKERCIFFSSVASSRKRKIIDSIESDIIININETECERMIDNNLSNCIKYSYPDTTIKVSLKKDKTNAILSFISEGKEIKNTDKLFDRFYRENESQRGSGIGLNIVKNVCDKYDIDIDISSSPNKNIFTYTFKI